MDEYPKPGIPPESAWADMKLMLDKGLPLPDLISAPSGSGWVKGAKILLTTILTSAALIVAYFAYKPQNEPFLKSGRTKSSQSTANTAKSADDKAFHTGDKSETTKESIQENSVNPGEPDSGEVLPSNKAFGNGGALSVATLNAGAVNKEKPDLNTPKKKTPTVSLDKENAKSTFYSSRSESTPKPKGFTKKTLPQNGPEQPKSHISRANRNRSPVNSNNYNSTYKSSVDRTETQASAAEVPKSRSATSPPEPEIDMASKFIENPVPASVSKPSTMVSLVEVRKPETKNSLASRLNLVQVRSKPDGNRFKSNGAREPFFNNIHGGLYWNQGLPFSGYDHYFMGTNATRFTNTSISNEVYKILFPGAWVSKTLGNGGEVLIKIKPYNQQFGNPNRADSTGVIRSDTSSTYYTLTRGLLKSSGFNLGLQYNHPINDRWAVGVGMGIQWQRKALVSNHIKRNLLTDYVPLVSLSSETDTLAYLRPYFFTGSAEILYSLKKLQIGAGITLPVTSMLGSRYPKLRPVTGQVTVRWRFR